MEQLLEGGVYLLCATTALACAALLLRGYSRSRSRLLLWCGLFFLAMVVENVVLFLDLHVVGAETNLFPVRRTVGLIGVFVLLYGLVWESK
jgi:hypothetical protein